MSPGSFWSPATPHGPSRSVTFTVSVIIHLDLGASEAGVAVQLTVVQVRLAVAATHGPLVGFTLLQGRRRRGSFTRVLVTPSNTPPGREGCPAARSPPRISPGGQVAMQEPLCPPTSMQRQVGSPFSVTAHSRPAPQKTLAQIFDLLLGSS